MVRWPCVAIESVVASRRQRMRIAVMGRKRKQPTMPPNVTDTPILKHVRLGLDPKDHQDLRVAAAEEGISMASCVKAIILEWLRERKKRKG